MPKEISKWSRLKDLSARKAPVSSNLHFQRLENDLFKTERALKGREECVTGDFAFDQGQKELRAFLQKLPVKLRTADQKKLAAPARLRDFTKIMNDSHAWNGSAAHYPVLPPRQRLTPRFIGLSTH